jgi:uncharacterized protein (TIGR01777 family)
MAMRIAISGSTGLIGSALARSLRGEGHDIVRLVRRTADDGGGTAGRDAAGPRPWSSTPAQGPPSEVAWDPKRQWVDTAALAGCDAVVHLAGAGVGDRRWTPEYKKEIRDSRVLGTAAVSKAVASLDKPPRVLIVGSAVGYYGDTGCRTVDEESPPGHGFLPGVCQEWEEAAAAAEEAGIRTVYARTGLVVSRRGGAWGRLFPLFKAGLGGRLGDGGQFWSFIALHDHIAALRYLVEKEDLRGPVNLTAPEPVTNREVTAAMGRVLHRPTPFPVPAPLLRAALGEMSGDVLSSQRVLPKRLTESGFRFAFPGIDDAIGAALR